MKKTTLKLRTTSIAVGLAALGMSASGAMAAPIASFDFTTGGGFTMDAGFTTGGVPVSASGTCSNGVPTACNLQGEGAPIVSGTLFDTISWGTPHSSTTTNEQSSLSIVHQTVGATINTNGDWATVDQLIHTNNVLNASGGYMTGINVFGLFTLDATGTFGGLMLGGTNPISFVETENSGTLVTCPQPAGGWPVGYDSPVCPDIYTTIPLVGSMMFHDDGDYQYFLEFQFFADPTKGALVEVLGDGSVRIFTQEGNPGISEVETQARIYARAIPVPEPGILALLGIGLAGLGVMNRRRKTETSS